LSREIRSLFSQVAPTYDLVNRVLTLGFDGRWRRRAARLAAATDGTLWLDVCSGTGVMARSLVRFARAETRIVALDFCPLMLAQGREKIMKRVKLVLGDVRSLPFPDACFDLVTLSFATRNINLSPEILAQEFREFRRVLRPAGRFVSLETSQPRPGFLRALFYLYVRFVVKGIGSWLSGSRAGYAYLAATIRRFYEAEILANLLRKAGFEGVRFRRLLFGVAAIHFGRKSGGTKHAG
jgi:demethylmenaquinone methyltransferase/2-methoxy-6-polyprenyl-1,4-benzoquinol methylase